MTRRDALRTAIGAGASIVAAAARPAIAQSSKGQPVSLSDFETLAQHLSPEAAAYIHGGAADGLTLRWNRESLDRIRLRPRVLVDVSRIDTRLTLFGQPLAFPVLVGPTAVHSIAHRDAEVATARAPAKPRRSW